MKKETVIIILRALRTHHQVSIYLRKLGTHHCVCSATLEKTKTSICITFYTRTFAQIFTKLFLFQISIIYRDNTPDSDHSLSSQRPNGWTQQHIWAIRGLSTSDGQRLRNSVNFLAPARPPC